MYTYKCVEVPVAFAVGKKVSHQEAVLAYQQIINNEAAQGWEYVCVDSIDSVYQPGCLEEILSKIPIVSMFIRKQEGISFKLIVFKKSV